MSIYRATQPQDVTVHDLKTHPAPFAAVWSGDKPFEVRDNDRKFATGDIVRLREWDPTTKLYSGRYVVAYVGYLVAGGDYGLPSIKCVFALRDAWRATEVSGTSPQ